MGLAKGIYDVITKDTFSQLSPEIDAALDAEIPDMYKYLFDIDLS